MAGFFKTSRDQIKNYLAPPTEIGIIVGYESNRPANLKVYVPSRNEVVMRSHYKPAQLTRELIDALSQEDADTDNEFVLPDDSPTSEGDNPTSEGASEINAAEDNHKPPADSLFNLTVKEAYSTLDTSDVDNSITVEQDNMTSHHVWDYVSPTETSGAILPCKLFLKNKYSASGEFLKLKARLVAGGHMQDRSIYPDLSAPTAAISSVFAIAAIAAHENRGVHTIDITGAYLNADMESNIFMWIPSPVAEILCERDPEFRPFMHSNGNVLLKLMKAQYGCIESAKL
jgi:hypothetical protein